MSAPLAVAPVVRRENGTASPARKPRSARAARIRGIVNVVVMTFAFGLIATLALPSYAFDPAANADPQVDYNPAEILKAPSPSRSTSTPTPPRASRIAT